jgi:hypothetical protein
MSNTSGTANQVLPDHQLDVQAGGNNAEAPAWPAASGGARVGAMTAEELQDFVKRQTEEARRNSPWGRLFT